MKSKKGRDKTKTRRVWGDKAGQQSPRRKRRPGGRKLDLSFVYDALQPGLGRDFSCITHDLARATTWGHGQASVPLITAAEALNAALTTHAALWQKIHILCLFSFFFSIWGKHHNGDVHDRWSCWGVFPTTCCLSVPLPYLWRCLCVWHENGTAALPGRQQRHIISLAVMSCHVLNWQLVPGANDSWERFHQNPQPYRRSTGEAVRKNEWKKRWINGWIDGYMDRGMDSCKIIHSEKVCTEASKTTAVRVWRTQKLSRVETVPTEQGHWKHGQISSKLSFNTSWDVV